MVDTRKTFLGYDYALCDATLCPHANNCVRYLTHQKAIETNYDTWGLTYLIVEPKDYITCDAFINAEKWAKRFDACNDEYDYGHNVSYEPIDNDY